MLPPTCAATSMSSWQYRKFSVVTASLTPPTGRTAGSAGGTRRCAAPARRTHRGDAEAAEAAVGGVELGARGGDRDPHRRVRLLHRLRQHVALGHPPAEALVAERLAASTSSAARGRTRPTSSWSSSGSTSKPPSSVHVDERAVPTSSRPPEMMSSAAARSATRIGWFISGTHTTAPWPTRMRSVCAATAARKTSGAEQCEYSSRKWCSTAHTQSKPSSSARRPARARCGRQPLGRAVERRRARTARRRCRIARTSFAHASGGGSGRGRGDRAYRRPPWRSTTVRSRCTSRSMVTRAPRRW